jgi:hypothetical protein
MTIEQTDKIDGMGIDSKTNEFVLLISDHLPWHDLEVHVAALEQKIGAYLNYVNSGQHFFAVPQAKSLPVRIRVIHDHKPTILAISILESVQSQLETMNVRFSYECLPEGY